MIRDRRQEDLEPLCAVLRELAHPAAGLAHGDLRAWLQEDDAEWSWVYDMAPVRMAPTRNVVGQVEVARPDDLLTARVAPYLQASRSDLLVVGKLFVRPSSYAHGIARHLLKESVTQVRALGKAVVLRVQPHRFLTEAFFERYGFAAVAPAEPDEEQQLRDETHPCNALGPADRRRALTLIEMNRR